MKYASLPRVSRGNERQTGDAMSLEKLKAFVQETTAVVDSVTDDRERMNATIPILRRLISQDDWLPEQFTLPHPQYYQQYLLYCDPRERFCIVSFVWGPAQQTPVHDHMVWGLVGMLRGSEISTAYTPSPTSLTQGERTVLVPGQIEPLFPEDGDVHQVRNAHSDQVSISIHVYGANIGKVRRHTFDPATGKPKDFISGFSSPVLPNFWA
jgi:predicted metal-dependent enzyme (double-stranded beta helix superfamily)